MSGQQNLYSKSVTGSVLFPPKASTTVDPHVITQLTADDAGWDLLNMEVRHYQHHQQWQWHTTEHEAVIVILGGTCSVTSNQGEWQHIGRRANVFSGMPYALYLPRHTEFTLTATSDELQFACAWVPTDKDFPAQLVTPEQSTVEVRGGHHATRQINSIIPPGFNCHRLVCCEVYTPHGNWSSYPPHKHDTHTEDADGNITEADLEEIYFYKILNTKQGQRGYAVQKIYTDDRSLDETVSAHNNDVVLVPEGYHPVSASYGYDSYYLNFLAGSAQTLTASDDPDYAWVKSTWTKDNLDQRIPMVNHQMEADNYKADVVDTLPEWVKTEQKEPALAGSV